MTKGQNIASWVIQALLIILFLMMGSGKLMSDPEIVENFKRWDMPNNSHYIIGALEILGAIGLLIPRLAGLAAVGLILLMVGALFTHITHGEIFEVMPMLALLVIILAGVVVYFRNPMKLFAKQEEATENN